MIAPAKSLSVRNAGFSLLELIVATLIFVVITGVVFSVLISAQARFKSEKEFMGAFQQANVAIDQITHDIHGAGYPSKLMFTSSVQGNPGSVTKYALPVAWSPSYPNTPCVIGSCISPAPFDLILEEYLGGGVQWIRYKLVGTVLYRAVVAKTNGDSTNKQQSEDGDKQRGAALTTAALTTAKIAFPGHGLLLMALDSPSKPGR